MYEWTRAWLRLRAEHPALRSGSLIDLFYDDDIYVFARQDKTETVIVAFNRSEHEKKVTVPIGLVGAQDGNELAALVGTSSSAHVVKGQATLTLSGRSAVTFKAR
jgi:hypothetical protein